jgi:hypothetical protein
MNPLRVFLDSCVLVEGLVAPWSASRGVLIVGRSMLFTFVLAEIVIEETERALVAKVSGEYGGARRLTDDCKFLLRRLRVERVPHVSPQQFRAARAWIRHLNDAPVLAAVVEAAPDWLLTNNTSHFDGEVSRKTGLRIATPADFLTQAGRIFP